MRAFRGISVSRENFRANIETMKYSNKRIPIPIIDPPTNHIIL